MLVLEGVLDGLVVGDCSRQRRKFLQHEFQKCGLADTVVSDQGHPAVHVDSEVQVPIEDFVCRVAELHVLRSDQSAVDILDLGEAELYDIVLVHLLREAVHNHLVQGLFLALRLAGQLG